jgi:hypothetical protein
VVAARRVAKGREKSIVGSEGEEVDGRRKLPNERHFRSPLELYTNAKPGSSEAVFLTSVGLAAASAVVVDP